MTLWDTTLIIKVVETCWISINVLEEVKNIDRIVIKSDYVPLWDVHHFPIEE